MKKLMQKLLCVVMVAFTTFFIACEPTFKENVDENDSSSIDFYSPEFKFVLKSHLCSKQLLAQGSDGSMTYLDGAKVSELGHWMLLDNVLYGTDTIYATFNPANNALVVDWEIADPEVLEIVAQSVEDNYIVVKAKKLGTTTIEASINNKARKVSINTTVVDAYATGMKGYDGKAGETGYLVENYTIFVESEDDNSSRKQQRIWMKIEQVPGADEMVDDGNGNKVPASKAPVVWSVSEEGIVDLDLRGETNDTCIILPKAEGMVTVLATCQYRTVQIITTVKSMEVFTAIDSLQFTDNDGQLFDKIWLSRGAEAFVNVACFPSNAYASYKDGYTWESRDVNVAQVASTGNAGTDEFSRKVVGVAAGDAKIAVSLGMEGKKVTREFDVKVCNAVTALSINVGGSTERQEVSVSKSKQFSAVIDDAAAAAEFGSLLRWKVEGNPGAWNENDEVSDFMTIDPITGVLTAKKETPALKSCLVYAELEHPKYPGHPTNQETIKKISNKIQCVVIADAVSLVFNPTSLVYTYYPGDDYTENAVFSDGSGNKLVINDSESMGDIYRTAGTINCSNNYYVTYGAYSFRSGTITVVDNGDGTYTYTFNLTSSQATLTGSATITPTVQ